jgi:hypothetical protein
MGLIGKEGDKRKREEQQGESSLLFLSSLRLSLPCCQGETEEMLSVAKFEGSRRWVLVERRELCPLGKEGGQAHICFLPSSSSLPSSTSPTNLFPSISGSRSRLTHSSLRLSFPFRPRLRSRGGGTEGESSRAGAGGGSYLSPPNELRGLRKKLSSLLLGSSKGKERADDERGMEENLRGGRSGVLSLFR